MSVKNQRMDIFLINLIIRTFFYLEKYQAALDAFKKLTRLHSVIPNWQSIECIIVLYHPKYNLKTTEEFKEFVDSFIAKLLLDVSETSQDCDLDDHFSDQPLTLKVEVSLLKTILAVSARRDPKYFWKILDGVEKSVASFRELDNSIVEGYITLGEVELVYDKIKRLYFVSVNRKS